MIKILFVVIISSIAPAQAHYIQLIYSEPMQVATITDRDNYTLYNQSMHRIPITNIVAINDSVVIIIVEPLDYKTNYLIKVENVKDQAGNFINNKNTAWFRFDGFDINQTKPGFKIRRN